MAKNPASIKCPTGRDKAISLCRVMFTNLGSATSRTGDVVQVLNDRNILMDPHDDDTAAITGVELLAKAGVDLTGIELGDIARAAVALHSLHRRMQDAGIY